MKPYRHIFSLSGLALILSVSSCRPTDRSSGVLDVEWTDVTASVGRLGPGVSIFAGTDTSAPLKAWYSRIDLKSPEVNVRVMASDEEDGRETPSSMAQDLGACVVVNGGYFRMDLNPSQHVGLLVSESRMISRATPGVFRNDLRFEIARASIGFDESGEAEIGWSSTRNDSIFVWPSPPAHAPGVPAPPLDYSLASPWSVTDALSGGPSLLDNEQYRISVNEEVFFGTSIPDVHPRTAAGIAADGDLILMVVDGRQSSSRGVDLVELADLMKSVGAVDALNLDGGGSSSIVVNEVLLNRPTGGTTQREVVSVISVNCDAAH